MSKLEVVVIWYLDNRAYNNMKGNKSFFSELNERVIRIMKCSDGSSVEIIARGNKHVCFQVW